MDEESSKDASVDWAERVNSRWIVHFGLGERAEEWMAYLAVHDPQRLLATCQAARAMVALCSKEGDPKPWFYAGLFSEATVDEARRFLTGHRFTSATVPLLEDNPDVRDWVDDLGVETHDLLDKLRRSLRDLRREGHSGS